MQQLSILDYQNVKQEIWQMTLVDYLNTPESRELPINSLLDTDLSRETPESLLRFNGRQLEVLCMYWGTIVSGTKPVKIGNLLNVYNTYRFVINNDRDSLVKLKAVELREFYRKATRNSGSMFRKSEVADNLIAWSKTVHDKFLTMLARERHRQAIISALRIGEDVPESVIKPVANYITLYRQIKGLPTEPVQMIANEWVEYALQIKARGVSTNADDESERHWQTIKKAISEGYNISQHVLDDHVKQTLHRDAEKERVTPKGAGWKIANKDELKVGDIVFEADGVGLKILEIGKMIRVENLHYNWQDEITGEHLYHETPFRIGDKVRYVTPDGNEMVGRIEYCKPSWSSILGQDFFIKTPNIYKKYDQWKYFNIPVWETEMVEPNPVARQEMMDYIEFGDMDYVKWVDLDGKEWLGHTLAIGNHKAKEVLLYNPESMPTLGPRIIIRRGYDYPAEPTDIKMEPTDEAISLHEKWIGEYGKSGRYADWRNLKRLHDLFGLYLPEGNGW